MSNEAFFSFRKFLTPKSLLLSAAAIALLAGPAAADSKCQSMIQGFDRAVAAGGKSAKVTDAKKHRKAGAAALAKGSEKACRIHLKQAQTYLKQAEASLMTDEADAADQ